MVSTTWKTATMNKPKSNARQPLLEVTILFEPTRLAAAHVADAYAQVVPTPRRAAKVPAAAAPPTGVQGSAAASSKRGGRP